MKTHFTRKNLISITLVFFYLLLSFFAALCLDGYHNIMKAENPVELIGLALFAKHSYYASAGTWALTILTYIYILLFVAAVIYEVRLAIYYEEKVFSKKWMTVIGITALICIVLANGIGILACYPWTPADVYIGNSYMFLIETLVVGFILFAVLLSLIGGAIMLYVNFKNIDKPFRFFGSKTKKEEEKEKAKALEEEKEQEQQGDLAASFGEKPEDAENAAAAGGLTGAGAGVGATTGTSLDGLTKEQVFPGLTMIDTTAEILDADDFNETVDLETLTTQFRLYLAKNEGLYFDISTIRAFIAGLSASRLLILEGLSGTGKSSIARYFSDFIGEESFFAPVQTTWRDRSSILGFFNDFSKSYNETEFLKRLYEYTYKERNINVMVLDEMNISRIEYYFADFLSILEYPDDQWRLKIMQLPFGFEAPEHLDDGILEIPTNTWFIGTANKDDSTYTITDKVYDRAITISFDDRNEEFEVEEDIDRMHVSYDYLRGLFDDAQHDDQTTLTKEELAKFKNITDYIYDSFDLTFGNRIMNQIKLFTPVYVKCGGTKTEALDFITAQKIICKLEGRYEDYVKKGLEGLTELLNNDYGEEEFKETKHLIARLLRRF